VRITLPTTHASRPVINTYWLLNEKKRRKEKREGGPIGGLGGAELLEGQSDLPSALPAKRTKRKKGIVEKMKAKHAGNAGTSTNEGTAGSAICIMRLQQW